MPHYRCHLQLALRCGAGDSDAGCGLPHVAGCSSPLHTTVIITGYVTGYLRLLQLTGPSLHTLPLRYRITIYGYVAIYGCPGWTVTALRIHTFTVGYVWLFHGSYIYVAVTVTVTLQRIADIHVVASHTVTVAGRLHLFPPVTVTFYRLFSRLYILRLRYTRPVVNFVD